MSSTLEEIASKYSKVPSNPNYSRLVQCLKERRADLLARSDVNALWIDYKTTGGCETDTLVLKFAVTKKKPAHELKPEEILPKEVDGFLTDVVEGKASRPQFEDFQEDEVSFDFLFKKYVPYMFLVLQIAALTVKPPTTLRGGQSIGPKTVQSTGTIAYFFRDGNSALGVATSGHVLRKNTYAISPSLVHQGTANDVIGKAMIKVAPPTSNRTEGVFVPFQNGGAPSSFSLVDGTVVGSTGTAKQGDMVKYYGADTGGFVNGVVKDVNWSGKVGSDQFVDQIYVTETQSKPGDSGSLLVDSTGNIGLGVLLAGDYDSSGAVIGSIHNHISTFCTDMGITFATS